MGMSSVPSGPYGSVVVLLVVVVVVVEVVVMAVVVTNSSGTAVVLGVGVVLVGLVKETT